MVETVYHYFEKLGFMHPLHPVVNYLPMGMVVGGFVFILIYALFKKPEYLTSASHCITLGFVSLIITALLGYMDWQYRLKGTMNNTMSMKIVLTAALALMMMICIKQSFSYKSDSKKMLLSYFLCLLLTLGLGYFGGELNYG